MIRWAVAAVALGAVVVVILVMAVRLASDSTTDVTDLEIGECVDLDLEPDSGSDVADVGLVDVVDCGDPHNAQVLATGDLNPDGGRGYPADAELFAETDAACGRATGGPSDDRFGVLPIAPTAATWQARSGRFVCMAVTFGGVPIEGDHAAIAASGET